AAPACSRSRGRRRWGDRSATAPISCSRPSQRVRGWPAEGSRSGSQGGAWAFPLMPFVVAEVWLGRHARLRWERQPRQRRFYRTGCGRVECVRAEMARQAPTPAATPRPGEYGSQSTYNFCMRSAPLRPLVALALLVLSAAAVAACASTKAEGQVHVLTWKGDVNPVMARYVDRGISTAERSHAKAVVLRLETPGGLDSSMRDIVQRIESAKVPVIVYVSPSGARAASAGTFITMAANVAVMAPNTSIGAATPINSNGSDIAGALGRKVTNDAVSYIRGIAELRGRNADWAEQAVRDAVSVNQNDAVSLNVVDFVATSAPELLNMANGRVVDVHTPDGGTTKVRLETAGAKVYQNDKNFFETVL